MKNLITVPPAPVTIVSETPLDAKDARFVMAHKLEIRDNQDGSISQYETVKRKNSADILPITVQNTVILILQYRIPVESWVLECPAGQIEEGESPIETVQKELLEETGYFANRKDIRQVGGAYPCSAGWMSELSYLFYARNCRKTEVEPSLTTHERLVSIELATKDVKRAIREVMEQGGLIDPRLDILARSLGML